MSAREIAQAIGTSDATVIRTSRSLGFEGFRELRRFVSGQTAEVPIEERLRTSLDAVENPDSELRANIERQRGDLMTMAERVPESEFREANRIIAGLRMSGGVVLVPPPFSPAMQPSSSGDSGRTPVL